MERGFLGISPFNLTPAFAMQIGVPVYEGIVVARVVENSGPTPLGCEARTSSWRWAARLSATPATCPSFSWRTCPASGCPSVSIAENEELEIEATLGELPNP